MKKLLSLVCAFALCAALFAPVTAKAAEEIIPEVGVKLSVKKMTEKTVKFKAGLADAEIVASYPVFKIENDKAATKKLNKAVKKRFIKDIRKHFEKPENNDWFTAEDVLHVEVYAVEDTANRLGNCLSVTADAVASLEASAYGTWRPVSVQFDLTTGKKIALKKLFDTKGLFDYLADYILTQVEETNAMFGDSDMGIYYPDVKKEDILAAFNDGKVSITFDACYMNIKLAEQILGPHAVGMPEFCIPVDEVMSYSIARDQLFYLLSVTHYDFATNGGVPYFWQLEAVEGEDVVGIANRGTFASVDNGPGFAGGPATTRFAVFALKPGTAKLKATYISVSGEVAEDKTQEWSVIVTDKLFITEVNG